MPQFVIYIAKFLEGFARRNATGELPEPTEDSWIAFENEAIALITFLRDQKMVVMSKGEMMAEGQAWVKALAAADPQITKREYFQRVGMLTDFINTAFEKKE